MACPPWRRIVLLWAAALALQAYMVYAATSATFISSYSTGAVKAGGSDPSITSGVATVVEFTSGSTITTGDKAEFVASGTNCNTVNPAYSVTVDGGNPNKGTATITLTDAGAPSPSPSGFKLCYSSVGGSDGGFSVTQTSISVTDLNTVTATTTTEFTGIDPAGIYSGVSTQIQFFGIASSGDKASFAANCADAAMTGLTSFNTADGQTASVSGTNAMQGPFTISNAYINAQVGGNTGVLRLCIRNSGGTDSVPQDNIFLSISAIGGNAADPVAWYGDKVRVWELPPHTLTPILSATDMTLHGQTFYYGGPWQQWFDRMVLATPGGERWVQIQVRKDILQFNRSSAPKGLFETLKVTLGHGDFDNPTMRTDVPGPNSAEIPLSFLGFDVVFWKMNRNARVANTGIGRAHRECMEVAGANIHFFVCSSPAHEFYGWQRDLSIENAHLDFIMVEGLHPEKLTGILPELWGMQPMSKETEALISYDSANETAPKPKGALEVPALPSSTSSMSALPKNAPPHGEAWAGGFGFKDLEESCKEGNQTILSCKASGSKEDTILSV